MMVSTMTALLAILAYGLAVGIAGLLLAVRERALRRKMRAAAEPHAPSVLAHTLHGRLRTDSGEELEVYFQSATR
jgi:hypothetical protein